MRARRGRPGPRAAPRAAPHASPTPHPRDPCTRITGFAHGSLLTQALYTAILMVVVGCVLNAFSTGLPSLESDFKGAWTSSDTRAYNATYVLAFFVAGLCALLTCLLALFAHSAFLGAKPVAAGGAAA